MFGIDDAISAGMKVLDKFIPDPSAKAKAESELRDALLQADAAQMEVNTAEAAHRSIFVAGWRPFVGWTCAAAFAFHFVGLPLIQFASTWAGVPAPTIAFDMNALLTVLMGMLGLGGLRTYEKIKGAAR